MLEAYQGNPPMTCFSKNREPTSRIDLAFVSAGMGRFTAAAATKPAGISATHAAHGLSYLDDIHRVGPQNYPTRRRTIMPSPIWPRDKGAPGPLTVAGQPHK